jgi:ankyrin repeat protein
VQALARLVERHADLNIANESGWTPLHAAVGGRRPDHELCVSLLLREGANARAPTKNGETPLQLAQRRSATAAILQLLQRANVAASVRLLRGLADSAGAGNTASNNNNNNSSGSLDPERLAALQLVLRAFDEAQSRRGTRIQAAAARRAFLTGGVARGLGPCRRPGQEPQAD